MRSAENLCTRLDALEDYFHGVPSHTVSAAAVARRGLGRQHVYGETPTWALVELLEEVAVRPEDVFIDIGCGTGRLPLVTATLGLRSVGIEQLTELVAVGRDAAQALALGNVTFIEGDAATVDMRAGTIFFSYWTTFPATVRADIAARVVGAVAGARVITVGEPMPHPRLELLRDAWHPWGLTTDLGGSQSLRVFFHRVLANHG